MKIACLGPPGTFSEEAARRWLFQYNISGGVKFFGLIPEIFSSVQSGLVTCGAVPVENSIEGTVAVTLDYLTREPGVEIKGEVILPVDHCLAVKRKDVGLRSIRVVYSHPQALGQCRLFLESGLSKVELRQTASTGEAARMLASSEDDHCAAVCSAFAAEKHGLEIAANNIQDFPNNKTRFFIVGPPEMEVAMLEPGKTSLAFSLPEDRPGALYEVLKDFACAGINLTKIESRPSKRELGRYVFYLDCEGYVSSSPLKEVTAGLKPKTGFLRVLGSYPRAG